MTELWGNLQTALNFLSTLYVYYIKLFCSVHTYLIQYYYINNFISGSIILIAKFS